MCWPLSDDSPKLIPIDEQPNHQIVHLFRLRKAQGATHEPLDPSPEIDVLALDFLRIFLAHVVFLGIDMPLVGSPAVRVKLCGSATEVMLTTQFRATVDQKASRKQGVTSSYGRQRHMPHVWIASVQEKWPHPSWQRESSV